MIKFFIYLFIVGTSVVYIVFDILQTTTERTFTPSNLNLTKIKIVQKEELTKQEYALLQKNIWGLKKAKVSNEKKEVKSDQKYYLKDERVLCKNTKTSDSAVCFEFIALNGNKAIFYTLPLKKFQSVKVFDTLDTNLTLISIKKSITLVDDTNTTYELNRGYVDITKYKQGKSNDKK